MSDAVNDAPAALPPWERRWLDDEALPSSYAALAARHFAPLAQRLATRRRQQGHALLVAVNGSQGSGKSTCCGWLVQKLWHAHGLHAVALSLDDFYRTRAEREQLAATVHPLLRTRGVPGTHDIALLRETLDALLAGVAGTVAVPRFDKARDDRRPFAAWDRLQRPLDVILLEGWCLGARPGATLEPPINALEAAHDRDGRWRRYVNEALRREFLPLYERVDLWVMLRAPSFDSVLAWRREQERKLAARAGAGAAVMSDEGVAEFIQYFERLTRHCLSSLPRHMDVIYELDHGRHIVSTRGLDHDHSAS
jgi:D-glycerate 3-kinase